MSYRLSCLKIMENNEKLSPWSLAFTIPVIGLKRVSSRKVGPWPRIFFEPLALKVASSTPLLVFSLCLLQLEMSSLLKLLLYSLLWLLLFPSVAAEVSGRSPQISTAAGKYYCK